MSRIYTYKITFEEAPHWYWGVHKELVSDDGYLGSPSTHKWMWDFYTPHLQVLEEFEYSEEGFRKARELEVRLIRPDLNNPLCLNENCGGHYSLEVSQRSIKKAAEKAHENKDELGRSVSALANLKTANERIHAEKDESGKSIHTLRICEKLHSEKDERGKSLHTLKLHQQKEADGKSAHAKMMARARWNKSKH
jgi:hypothetical protein